ncbi:carbamoyltransferase [Candidatus Omnitrophota bacterium]
MKILGIGPSMVHDPAAALMIDGRIVAAVEEERLTREKHASGKLPIKAIEYCLETAGLKPSDLDIIAFPWDPRVYHRYKFGYFRRKFFSSPNRAIKSVSSAGRRCRAQRQIVEEIFRHFSIDASKTKAVYVEHHLAHAASAFLSSGFKEAAILSIDGSGEFPATFLGRGRGKTIETIKEICVPDSLGLFYSTFTEYLGFRSNNGEYKLMGMAPYGNPSLTDLSRIVRWDEKKKTYRCNDDYVWVKRSRRHIRDTMYSRACVSDFGPPRSGDGLAEPYTHIAAAVQKRFEDIVLRLVDHYLKPELIKHGTLCFAGGCALNVSLNRILRQQPYVKNLWVQPASHDAGASLGAAAYAAAARGEDIEPMRHAYLGPEFSDARIEVALKSSKFKYRRENNISRKVAGLLAQGEVVGWFQGRMEWGPRALGNRSILGNPGISGIADKINALIKFREKWRPFCPSILEEFAHDILQSDHHATFMTIAFEVNPAWREKIGEVVHVNGTCRPQVVEKNTNPRFYELIESFYRATGIPAVINTSLNRRGEPIVCSPEDSLAMLEGSGLTFMAIGDFLVSKD